MARSGRRLGSFLTVTPAVVDAAVAGVAARREQLIELLALLVGTTSPCGGERPLAERLAEHVRQVCGSVCEVDLFGDARANVVMTAPGDAPTGLACYAHLDTSLTGEPDRDGAITGDSSSYPPIRFDGSTVTGLGLAVAKASAALAVVAFDAASEALAPLGAAHGLSVLLTSGGTHRWPVGEPGAATARFGSGARRALARGFHPAGVVNVKAGAPAPLHEEPGAAYLTVRIRGPWEPALFRGDHPGTLAALPVLLTAVEAWRSDVVARPLPVGSVIGREVALGALRAGSLDKPDLLPGAIDARVFAVLAEGDSAEELAAELEERLSDACRTAGLADIRARVSADVADPAGRTAADDPLVVAACAAWERHIGVVPEVRGWRGSTDSCTFRAAGIPTVRMGPPVRRDPDDPRLDQVDIDVLLAHASATAETLVRATTARRTP